MKAVVAAFNQEKALVGAFSVITNLRMELFEALVIRRHRHQPRHLSASTHSDSRHFFISLNVAFWLSPCRSEPRLRRGKKGDLSKLLLDGEREIWAEHRSSPIINIYNLRSWVTPLHCRRVEYLL